MNTQDKNNLVATFKFLFSFLVCIGAYWLGAWQEQQYPTPVITAGCKVPKGTWLAMLDNCPGSYKMNKDEFYIIFEDGSTKTVYSETKDKARAMSYQTGK